MSWYAEELREGVRADECQPSNIGFVRIERSGGLASYFVGRANSNSSVVVG